jgi:hypothetical protein
MSHSHLNFSQRQVIEKMSRQGAKQAAIARAVGVHRSTIKKELDRNSLYPGRYNAYCAQHLSMDRKKRGELKKRKFIHFKGKGYGYSSDANPACKKKPDPYALRKKIRDFRSKRRARFRNLLSYNQLMRRIWLLSKRKRNYYHEAFDRTKRDSAYWRKYSKYGKPLDSGRRVSKYYKGKRTFYGTKRTFYRKALFKCFNSAYYKKKFWPEEYGYLTRSSAKPKRLPVIKKQQKPYKQVPRKTSQPYKTYPNNQQQQSHPDKTRSSSKGKINSPNLSKPKDSKEFLEIGNALTTLYQTLNSLTMLELCLSLSSDCAKGRKPSSDCKIFTMPFQAALF